MSRIDLWKSPKYLTTTYSGDNGERVHALSAWIEESRELVESSNEFTHLGIIEACKELVFDVVDGRPIFHAIMYSFDADRAQLRLDHMLDILVGDEATVDFEEEVANTLAIASAMNVPVFPNTPEVSPVLAKYHRSMLINGFVVPDGDGNRVRLMLSGSPKDRIDDPRYISEIDVTESYSPAEIALIQEAVSKELGRLQHTRVLLDTLAAAISLLDDLLLSEVKNEGKLQECLTTHPILFGTEYTKTIPKHRLGAEYEMDYALQRVSGVVDLVEIEASTHKLFVKSGDPSHSLVHAEQQVIDWLAWIERNHPYAETTLPGLVNPVGFVVIGRSMDLSADEAKKLRHRNQLFRGRLQIMTYDDLSNKAKALLERLEGLANDD